MINSIINFATTTVSLMLNPNEHRNQWFEIDATKRGMDLQ
jgi:hypothetical protein